MKEHAKILTVSANSFNVLNHVNNTTYIGVITSPFFGQANSAQPPEECNLTSNSNSEAAEALSADYCCRSTTSTLNFPGFGLIRACSPFAAGALSISAAER